MGFFVHGISAILLNVSNRSFFYHHNNLEPNNISLFRFKNYTED